MNLEYDGIIHSVYLSPSGRRWSPQKNTMYLLATGSSQLAGRIYGGSQTINLQSFYRLAPHMTFLERWFFFNITEFFLEHSNVILILFVLASKHLSKLFSSSVCLCIFWVRTCTAWRTAALALSSPSFLSCWAQILGGFRLFRGEWVQFIIRSLDDFYPDANKWATQLERWRPYTKARKATI